METINSARHAASRFTKAQTMTQEGYTFETTDTNNQFIVRSPEGRFHAVNLEARVCTCEDWKKNRVNCKHIYWMQSQVDAMDTAACEALCAEYDALYA